MTGSSFVSCHPIDGGGYSFIATVDLTGGENWTPADSNLEYVSRDRYRNTETIVNDSGASGAPPQNVTFSSVDVYDTAPGGPGNHVLRFPSQYVVHGHCPS